MKGEEKAEDIEGTEAASIEELEVEGVLAGEKGMEVLEEEMTEEAEAMEAEEEMTEEAEAMVIEEEIQAELAGNQGEMREEADFLGDIKPLFRFYKNSFD